MKHTREEQERTQIPSCFATSLSFLIFLLLCPVWVVGWFVVCFTGCFLCCGKGWLHRTISGWRFHVMISYPECDNSAWALFCRRVDVLFQLVDWMLVVAKKDLGEAITSRYQSEGGTDTFVWMNWPCVANHTRVKQMLLEPEKYCRSPLAAIPFSLYCMSPTASIFVNGDAHDRQRAGMLKLFTRPDLVSAIQRFDSMFAAQLKELVSHHPTQPNAHWDHNNGPILEYLVKVLYQTIIGLTLTEEETAIALHMLTKMVPLKVLHPVIHNYMFFNVLAKRYHRKNHEAAKIAQRSQLIDLVLQECPELTRERVAFELYTVIQINIVVLSICISLAFNKIASDPAKYAPLAVSNPEAFAWEAARLNPAAPVIVLTLTEPTEVTFRGKAYTAKPGTKVGACILAANRDPKIFPDPHTFRIDREVNPGDYLSWAASGHTPTNRSCLAMQLSVSILKSSVSAYGRSLLDKNAGSEIA